MIGVRTYLCDLNIQGGSKIDFRAETVNLALSKNIQNESIVMKHTLPNTELNDMGTNNRMWDVNGRVDVTNLSVYDNEYHPFSVELAGSLIRSSGSKFFCDEILAPSGTEIPHWVYIENINFTRSNLHSKSETTMGYAVDYTLKLIETGNLTE